MRYPCTGVILAGGLQSRFSGISKAFINLGGTRIIDQIYGVLKELFYEIILVTTEPLKYCEWDLPIATDLFPVRSSLTGIHAGLFFAANPYVFFTACDTPFLKKELIETILDCIEERTDVCIPETSAGIEPICAVYSKRCLKPIERQIADHDLKIRHFFQKVRVTKISEKILREKDPDLVSFFNINTSNDLIIAEEMIKGKTK